MHEGDKTNLVTSSTDGAGGTDPNADGLSAGGGLNQSGFSSLPGQRRLGLKCPSAAPRGMTLIVLVCVIFSAAVTIALILTIIFGDPQVQKLGAVAADTADASKCGLEMLSSGGSAVDAAVAALLCSCVVQYPVTGLGGGGLMLVHDHRGDKTTLLDFLPSAPANASVGMFDNSTAALNTGLGTGVPGLARGLEDAHRRFGRLKWSNLFAPAIRLASDGFKVTTDLNRLITLYAPKLAKNSLLKRWFLTEDGAAKLAGAVIRMPELAGALTTLRDQGAQAMYTGSLASDFLEAVNANGGRFTASDLAGYRVVQRTPLVGHYRNFTLRTFPPPSSGGAFTLLVAQVLAGYPVNATGLLYHRAAEAMKLALGAVQFLGDSPGAGVVAADIASPAFADRVRALIQDVRVLNATQSLAYSSSVWPPSWLPASSQLVAVDNDELYVAMETGVNSPFATGLTTPTGLLLNNALANFAPASAGSNHSNAAGPGRRPATMMSPGFAFNPRQRCGLRFAFGASNSTSIPGTVAWIISRISDLASDPTVCPVAAASSRSRNEASNRKPCLPASAAVSAPRLNPLLPSPSEPPRLEVEKDRLPPGVSELLTDLGHRLSPLLEGLGRAQVIAMDMYSLAAQSDSFRSPEAVAASLPQNGRA